MIVERLPDALAGQRLDRVVALLVDVSRAEVSRLIEAGLVEHNGEAATAGKVRVAAGDVVSVDVDPEALEPPSILPDGSVDFDVVYSDEHIVVVDKPVGLVVHPGAGQTDATLAHGLLARFPDLDGVGQPDRPGIVHRLDAGTSGLLVVARTEAAYATLTDALAARTVHRRYDVLVVGDPSAPTGTIDAPIGRSTRTRTRMAVVADGRPARTHYEVRARWPVEPPVARLSCRLETGRTHQIRVHLAAIDLPVLGDQVYGRSGVHHATRPMLHAAELTFEHPGSGEQRTFTAPLPADFIAVVDGLRGAVDEP